VRGCPTGSRRALRTRGRERVLPETSNPRRCGCGGRSNSVVSDFSSFGFVDHSIAVDERRDVRDPADGVERLAGDVLRARFPKGFALIWCA
jgi:hypothetical protein